MFLEQTINRLLGNKPYSEKRAVYSNSIFLLVKCQAFRPVFGIADQITKVVSAVPSFEKWNLKAIEDRQANGPSVVPYKHDSLRADAAEASPGSAWGTQRRRVRIVTAAEPERIILFGYAARVGPCPFRIPFQIAEPVRGERRTEVRGSSNYSLYEWAQVDLPITTLRNIFEPYSQAFCAFFALCPLDSPFSTAILVLGRELSHRELPDGKLPAPAIIASFGVAAHWSPGNGVTVQQESIPGRES